MKKDLRSMDLEEMQELLKELKEPGYRAKQLFHWIHKKEVDDFSKITNFSLKLIEQIKEITEITPLKIINIQESQDGTVKFLLKLKDNNYIECVLMRYRGDMSKNRNTLCISTQVGCAMGCGFCATGQSGFKRNLTVGEILGQVYTVNNFLENDKEELKIGNVVYMGMGEPLLNFDNVISSIKILNNPQGQNISIRRITLSTCGIVPQIYKLAEINLDLVLAISLHAPTDELRSKLMPVNNLYPLKELKKACNFYIKKTNRRITFEYILIADFNDQQRHAKQLVNFLKDLLCHVNLIPINPVGNKNFKRPDKNKIFQFQRELKKNGIEASIRAEKGTDILAACGQLRGKVVKDL